MILPEGLTKGASYENTDKYFQAYLKTFKFVESVDELLSVLQKLKDKEAALDFETTGLTPYDGAHVRITSICDGETTWVIDHYLTTAFRKLVPLYKGIAWYVYNAKFELTWLCAYVEDEEEEEFDVLDVDFMAKAVIGGGYSSLAAMCRRDLKAIIDKTEQNSDWSRDSLTQSQLEYAGFDAYMTFALAEHWRDKMTAGHWNGADVFQSSVLATSEAERTGLELDYDYHEKLVKLWEIKRDTFERCLRKYTPPKVIDNLNSKKQISEFLTENLPKELYNVWPKTKKTKQLQQESAYLKAVSRRISYPFSRWIVALVGYNYYSKYLSTYGDTLLNKQKLSGKITARFNIAQALTGRYSSSNANMQNIPRKPVVRTSFYTSNPAKKLMILADYSGIEVRVLAELSQDKNLLHDAVYSDVHSASAAQIYDIELEYFLEVIKSEGQGKHGNAYYPFKGMRSNAKGFTFQLTYGAGPEALSDVLKCTFEDAVIAIEKWSERYPDAYGYRELMYAHMMETGYLPVCDGRTIKIHRDERTMPVAANYPIQGAAASVMYRAMHHTYRLVRERDIDAQIAATVHDELLSYSATDQAEEAYAAQIRGMELGWLDIFPNTSLDNLIDGKIGTTWADKP